MREVIYANVKTRRRLRKQLHASGQDIDFRSVPDGEEEVFYEVSVDTEQLAALAVTAAGNKSQQCNLGPLRVKVLQRRRL